MDKSIVKLANAAASLPPTEVAGDSTGVLVGLPNSQQDKHFTKSLDSVAGSTVTSQEDPYWPKPYIPHHRDTRKMSRYESV